MLASLLLVVFVGAANASTAPRDLPFNDVFDEAGKFFALPPGVYQASSFPIALRLTVSAGWNGAQWKANQWSPQEIERRHLKCPRVCQPPYYGWVAIAKGGLSAKGPPQALILIMTGFDRTPSVANTLVALHRPSDVSYEQTTRVALAGTTGMQFAGQTVGGANRFFTPFSPPSHGAAGSTADAIEIDGSGHPFRVTVLSVRGKTVVVLVGSLVLSPDDFQKFLPQADRVLGSLRFVP
jgi:hypothetical protein